MSHPLDISHILKAKGVHVHEHKPYQPPKKKEVKPVDIRNETQSSEPQAPRIKQQYWIQLHAECRKLLTSRVWKGVDFNPMFEHLDDLTKITAKWLRWAIPTYVNGLESGPIHDWLQGVNRQKDFHYVLVGEHLRFMKERREERKSEHKVGVLTDAWNKVTEELSGHLDWFKSFLDREGSLQVQVSG